MNIRNFLKLVRLFFPFIAALALLWPAPSAALTQAAEPALQTDLAGLPTNRIIIKYRMAGPDVAPLQDTEMARLSAAAGIHLQYFRAMSEDMHVLELPERMSLERVQEVSNQLMSLPEVEYAEPDRIFQHTLTPNDTQYGNQWHYFDTWGINAPAAWDITTGKSNIVVAVVDTGITNHADLSGRTVPGYDFISDALVANDGHARDSSPSDPGDWITFAEAISGYFAGCPVSDSSWHGTHVAGTIGAVSNNGSGVTGINWHSKILPLRVLGKCGGYTSDIVDAIKWAAGLSVPGVPANGFPAKVINLSLGGNAPCDATWQNAVNSVTAAGSVLVVAAGNSNQNASNFSPANCNGVITVSATNKAGSRASYSNYGSVVEISAPGGETSGNVANGVLSTLNSGTTVPVSDSYVYYQGTSMATPHVTGVISLMFSRNPNLTPTQVLQIIQNTSKDFPGGSTCNTSICGTGIVDAAAALNAVTPQSFVDVPTNYWAHSWIETLYDAGITGGCVTNPPQYCPESTVTRAQMAIFLLRGIHGASYTPPAVGASTGFNDVPTSYWAAAWIKRLAAEGITGGCGGGNYCPENAVTRAQMAIFLLKAKHGSSYNPPAVGASTGFGDVPTGYWAAAWIKQLAAESITGGCGGGNYCPESPVTRAQMAVFLVKTFNLP